jgi:Ni/Fe-hydrogenase subunit HybB-like protein
VGLLIVLYPFITGLVAGAFILASLNGVQRAGGEPTYRLALLTRTAVHAGGAAARCSCTSATRSVHSRCI